MKKLSFFFVFLSLSQYLFSQNVGFKYTYSLPNKVFFANVIELENGNYLATTNELDSFGILVSKSKSKILTISKLGRLVDSLIFQDSVKSFRIDHVVKTGYGYAVIGEMKQNRTAYMWFVILDNQFRIVRQYFENTVSDVLFVNKYTIDKDSTLVVFSYSGSFNGSSFRRTNYCGAKIDKFGNRTLFTKLAKVSWFFDIFERKDSSGYVVAEFGSWMYLDTMLQYRYNVSFISDSVSSLDQAALLRKTDTSYWYSGRGSLRDPSTNWSLFLSEIGQSGKFRNIKFYKQTSRDTISISAIARGIDITKDKRFIYWAGTKNYDQDYYYASPDKRSWFALTKIDTATNTIWRKDYGGDAYYVLYGLIATSDGGCLMYGSRYDYNNEFRTDGVIIKVDANGVLNSTTTIPMAQLNILAFPNPSNGQLSFKVPPSVFGQIDLAVFDISGKLVYQKKEAALSETFDLSNLPNGNYIYQIFQDGTPLSVGKWQKIGN